ncbi:MAG: hypothetical protein LBH97_06550 [Treponema sp.]|jgi:hypothetical protein|nr:hypothetical protein [Treponema sp.]
MAEELELVGLLAQVITSWQVIAVTIAVAIYISLVSRVTSRRYRPRLSLKIKPRQKKSTPTAAGTDVVIEDSNSDLGLEEAED